MPNRGCSRRTPPGNGTPKHPRTHPNITDMPPRFEPKAADTGVVFAGIQVQEYYLILSFFSPNGGISKEYHGPVQAR